MKVMEHEIGQEKQVGIQTTVAVEKLRTTIDPDYKRDKKRGRLLKTPGNPRGQSEVALVVASVSGANSAERLENHDDCSHGDY